MPLLCLGEALVDLICPAPVSRLADAPAFVPHPGGATANVAVHAARLGAQVSLAGGAGADAWGAWLAEKLEAEGVDLGFFALVEGALTPLAFVTADASGEPSYLVRGERLESLAAALAGRVEEAIEGADGLFFGSNTLVDGKEREVTERARDLALERERPVLIDANVRLARWRSAAEAAATVNACVPDAFLVRCNQAEAELLTGERDPERAAVALRKAGARNVVISLGADGALLRGDVRADSYGVPAGVLSTVGAGDALTGTLVGRLALAGYYPPAAAAALDEAVRAGAWATEEWSAW